jgi:hypothetical protein
MKVLTKFKLLPLQYKSQYLGNYGDVTVLKINNSRTAVEGCIQVPRELVSSKNLQI